MSSLQYLTEFIDFIFKLALTEWMGFVIKAVKKRLHQKVVHNEDTKSKDEVFLIFLFPVILLILERGRNLIRWLPELRREIGILCTWMFCCKKSLKIN